MTEKDLDHFLTLLDDKVGDRLWHHMMEHTTQNMTYQAWRHEPEVNSLPAIKNELGGYDVQFTIFGSYTLF